MHVQFTLENQGSIGLIRISTIALFHTWPHFDVKWCIGTMWDRRRFCWFLFLFFLWRDLNFFFDWDFQQSWCEIFFIIIFFNVFQLVYENSLLKNLVARVENIFGGRFFFTIQTHGYFIWFLRFANDFNGPTNLINWFNSCVLS